MGISRLGHARQHRHDRGERLRRHDRNRKHEFRQQQRQHQRHGRSHQRRHRDGVPTTTLSNYSAGTLDGRRLGCPGRNLHREHAALPQRGKHHHTWQRIDDDPAPRWHRQHVYSNTGTTNAIGRLATVARDGKLHDPEQLYFHDVVRFDLHQQWHCRDRVHVCRTPSITYTQSAGTTLLQGGAINTPGTPHITITGGTISGAGSLHGGIKTRGYLSRPATATPSARLPSRARIPRQQRHPVHRSGGNRHEPIRPARGNGNGHARRRVGSHAHQRLHSQHCQRRQHRSDVVREPQRVPSPATKCRPAAR